MAAELIRLTIDGIEVEVPKGTTVYHASQKVQANVPIFCYQDRMPPFGACRVCLVEVEKMAKLQASCTLEAQSGMVVHTQSKRAKEGREGILELLLINHPLDCPICDRGGECALQEFSLEHGPGESRFFEEKRKFTKGVPLGPVLTLDRERCIACARCTRFGEEVAGDYALQFIDRGYKTEVGTPDGEPVRSKFIGNTIMICPVGALTSSVYRFRARPWDNDSVETSCTLCPVGCSMRLDSRDGEIVRTRSKENKEVNDIWLCDKGWFGYEYASSKERLDKPLIRKYGKLEIASWEEALNLIARKLEECKTSGKIAGFGGNTLTFEENTLFEQLMREGAQTPHLDHRVGLPLFSIEQEGLPPGMEINFEECSTLSSALVLGCDLTAEFPLLWLRLKEALNRGGSLYFAGHYAPEITSFCKKMDLIAPGEEGSALEKQLQQLSGKASIFIGSQYLNSPDRKGLLSVCLKYIKTHPGTSLNLLEGSGNSMGARLAGMRPDFPDKPKGMNIVEVLEKAASSGWDLFYVAGADPAAKYPSALWTKVREKLGFLIVQELFLTETAAQADVVLPVLSAFEKQGSFINIEGRACPLKKGKLVPEGCLSDFEIFKLLGSKLGLKLKEGHYVREQGKKPDSIEAGHLSKVNHQDLKASFAHALFDQGNRMKHNPHLLQLAKTPKMRLHPEEAVKRGIKEGSVVLVKGDTGSIQGQIELDSTVAPGTLVLPLGFEALPVKELSTQLINGMQLKVEVVC